MRATLDIDDTVLAAAWSLALTRDCSLGEAISELARRGLSHEAAQGTSQVAEFSYSPFPIVVGDPSVLATVELIAGLRG